MSFAHLQLPEPLVRAVAAEGYTAPTPIQEKAIPHVLAGKDLIGVARTGTGKTAAFALPLLSRLAARPRQGARRLRLLVLTPTRELATQVGDSFATYGQHLDVRHTVIFGGVGQEPQVQRLRAGVDILVATPGRLLDLMQQRLARLDTVEMFVLDEADRMLDMGFIHDVRRVVSALPKERQTLFFSATMPEEIRSLAASILRDPVRVEASPVSSTAEKIDQSIYFAEKAGKRALLAHLLADPAITRALVFTRTKHGANRVAEQLEKAGVEAAAIHGNKSQSARERALGGFKAGTVRVLVATDIAARGIDVDGVSHVFNFDLPEVPEQYVHRIGRTARAGASGVAIAFCSQEERPLLADVERLTKQKLRVMSMPAAVAAAAAAMPAVEESRERRDGGGRGGRGGRRDGGGRAASGRPSGRPASTGRTGRTGRTGQSTDGARASGARGGGSGKGGARGGGNGGGAGGGGGKGRESRSVEQVIAFWNR